jgi:beta-N-acetylhexosaminidase
MRCVVAVVLVALGVLAVPANAQTERPIRMSPHDAAVAAYNRMSPRQRVGQLFMTGVPSKGPGPHLTSLLTRRAIGNALLDHNTAAGRHSDRLVTWPLAADLTIAGVAPFVGTDQEGGEVQRLTGPGFALMPTALKQGAMRPAALRAASALWGAELASAGVDLDLAPVADTVPAKGASSNQPIGRFDREFGHRPAVVARHVVAFVRGMRSTGVTATLKHFPGLGRATGNTDTKRHVTDPTTRHDPYLVPFRDGIRAGARSVMVSSATYPHIDPSRRACFSQVVMTSMLRKQLGFRGVVVSDDLGTSAMSDIPLGSRATRFFAAGGTILLDTSPRQLPAMVRAVLSQQSRSASFAAEVKRAVITDLVVKVRAGLVGAAP